MLFIQRGIGKQWGRYNMAEQNRKELAPALRWGYECRKFLNGKTIKTCRYLTKEELVACFGTDDMPAPLVIEFTDGHYIFPMSDDEGNSAGALATSHTGMLSTIPVVGR